MSTKTILIPLLLSLAFIASAQTTEEYLEKGYAELENNRYIAAKGWFDKAVELDQKNDDAYFNRGLTNLLLEEYEPALRDFKTAANVSASDSIKVMSYVNTAYILRNINRELDEALAYAEKALYLDSVSWAAWYIHGLTLYDSQENKKAILSFDHAIALNPTHPGPYYDQALTKTRLNLFNEAIAGYDKSIELDPNYVKAYNNRGYVKTLQEDYEGALVDFNASLALETSSYSHNNRGYVKLNLGDYQGAKKDCEIAIKLDESNSWAYHYLGLVYYEMGKEKKACELFHRAVELGKTEVAQEITEKCK